MDETFNVFSDESKCKRFQLMYNHVIIHLSRLGNSALAVPVTHQTAAMHSFSAKIGSSLQCGALRIPSNVNESSDEEAVVNQSPSLAQSYLQ